MIAKKRPVVKSTKPNAAPKASTATPKAIVPSVPKTPEPVRTAKAASGNAKAVKEKKKKEKKMNDGDNAAGRKKMVRDSFTMPAADYALIGTLKARTLASGTAVKKSELLRGGLVALANLSAAQLIDLISAMPAIKTGRPGHKKK